MAKKLNGTIEVPQPDNLFASAFPHAETGMVSLTANKGTLKRGTILSKNTTAGTYEALATGGTASFILADDVDTTETPAVGQVYRTGHFVQEALLAGTGYTITVKDKEDLRAVGILLSTGIGYEEE